MPITKLNLQEMKSRNNPRLTKGILKSIIQKTVFQEIYESQKSPSQGNLPLI